MLHIDTPIQRLSFRPFDELGIEVLMKRDDLIHPFISGNKWRKLKYNIRQAQTEGKLGILTVGGAYSNHLIATACACAFNGLKSVGIVRGEELNPHSNHVLRLCAEYGMELRFVRRSDYQNKEELYARHAGEDMFTVPEGGDNELGVQGCEEILPHDLEADHIVVAVGTGTTMCGLINANGKQIKVHGIAALKGAEYLFPKIKSRTTNSNWDLHTNYAFGGFGKYNNDQLRFNQSFASETGILLDPVYTGKMMRSLPLMVANKHINPGQRVLCVHTGGLTGVLTSKWLSTSL
jgi:1-aminocyclopropane-1-carboxylate deaminase